MKYPQCNKCGQTDWRLVEERKLDEHHIDLYKCNICALPMSWGYVKPTDRLTD